VVSASCGSWWCISPSRTVDRSRGGTNLQSCSECSPWTALANVDPISGVDSLFRMTQRTSMSILRLVKRRNGPRFGKRRIDLRMVIRQEGLSRGCLPRPGNARACELSIVRTWKKNDRTAATAALSHTEVVKIHHFCCMRIQTWRHRGPRLSPAIGTIQHLPEVFLRCSTLFISCRSTLYWIFDISSVCAWGCSILRRR
jgi:hypothetical protein